MNLQTDIKPITYMKTQSAKLIEEVNRTRSPIVITQNGEARAVIQDVASYEATRKALLLLRLAAQGMTDVIKGRTYSHKEVMEHTEKLLSKYDKAK